MVITVYVDYPVLHITIKSVCIFSRKFGVVLHASLAIFLTKEGSNKYIKLLCKMKLEDKLQKEEVVGSVL